MPKLAKTLSVYPNPYAAPLDHEGRPAQGFHKEPDLVHGDSGLFYIGATRAVKELHPGNARLGIAPKHDHEWTFTPEPVTVGNTDYYRKAVRSRELVAADLGTWIAAGGTPESFQDPKTVLAHAKAGAQARHKAHYGEESEACAAHWAEFHGEAKPAEQLAPETTPHVSAPEAKE